MPLSVTHKAAAAQTDPAAAHLICSNDRPAFALTELILCYNVDAGYIDFLCITGPERSGGRGNQKGKRVRW